MSPNNCDPRPRIHIFPRPAHMAPGTCAWSIGWAGLQTEADSPGAAVDAALAALGRRGDVVVILETVA